MPFKFVWFLNQWLWIMNKKDPFRLFSFYFLVFSVRIVWGNFFPVWNPNTFNKSSSVLSHTSRTSLTLQAKITGIDEGRITREKNKSSQRIYNSVSSLLVPVFFLFISLLFWFQYPMRMTMNVWMFDAAQIV